MENEIEEHRTEKWLNLFFFLRRSVILVYLFQSITIQMYQLMNTDKIFIVGKNRNIIEKIFGNIYSMFFYLWKGFHICILDRRYLEYWKEKRDLIAIREPLFWVQITFMYNWIDENTAESDDSTENSWRHQNLLSSLAHNRNMSLITCFFFYFKKTEKILWVKRSTQHSFIWV